MQNQLIQFISAPTFVDKRQTQLARFINVALLAIFISTTLLFLVAIMTSNSIANSSGLHGVIGGSLLLKLLLQMKQLRFVSVSLVALIWLSITISAMNRDGIYAPIISAYVVVIILTGILFNHYATLFMTLACILSSLGLVYGIQIGRIFRPPLTLREPEIVWLIYVLIFSISGVLVYLTARLVKQAIRTSEATARQLELSSQNLRRAESLANLGNFEYDIRTNVILWSDEVYRIFGVPLGKPITTKYYQQLLSAEVQDQLVKKVKEAISTGMPFEIEHSIVLENGNQKDIHTSSYPVRDENGQITKFFGILRDVTAQKRAARIQEVLLNISRSRHETEHLHALLHHTVEQLRQLITIPNCFVALYDEQTELYTFPYGYDQHDLDWSPQRLDQSLTDYVRRQGKAYLFVEENYHQLEHHAEIALDDKRAKVWLGAPLKTQEQVFGVIVIQNYENPDAYQQSDLDLLAYVAENIASVVHSKKAQTDHLELQIQKQKNDFLQEFISHMTHDLKTPLSVIKNSADLLKMVKDPSRQKEYIERINYQLDRLDKMIEDILTISRLDHLQRSDHVFIDLNALLNHTTQQLNPKIQQKNLHIQLDLAPDLPHVMGIEADLTRAILNLLENATHYTQDHGQITVRTYVQDDDILCEIRDTGIGIHPNDLANIFDRFFRADNARSFERGTGLGLAIVHRIIELHNGSITVDSQLGEGTTFTIRLARELSYHVSTA